TPLISDFARESWPHTRRGNAQGNATEPAGALFRLGDYLARGKHPKRTSRAPIGLPMRTGAPSGDSGRDDLHDWRRTSPHNMAPIFPSNAKFAVRTDGPACPCVYMHRPPQGWMLVNGRWEERWADVICKAGMITKADFDAWFGELPPLPPDAFV